MDETVLDSMGDPMCAPWLSAYQDPQAGADYLTRSMLEPILEECTDDEESTTSASSVVTAPDLCSWSEERDDDGMNGGGGSGGGGGGGGGSSGGAWSSESETGSVIRVDFNIDQDTLSEREFACPVKRRRQDEFVDDEVQLRHPHKYSNGDVEFKFRIDFSDATDSMCKRFRAEDANDFFIDADALSFSSLSRSSSLVQFESLERQLLENSQQSSSFGGSTPSLYSVQSAGDRSNAANAIIDPLLAASSTSAPYFIEPLKISSRNYFDIEQIDFSRAPFLNGSASILATANQHSVAPITAPKQMLAVSKHTADGSNRIAASAPLKHRFFVAASSSENSLYSDGESSPPIGDSVDIVGGSRTFAAVQHQKQPPQSQPQFARSLSGQSCTNNNNNNSIASRCKSSVENLSEDSGYGEQQQQQLLQYGQLRHRSRSIPNFTQDHYLIAAEEPALYGGLTTATDGWADMMHKSLEHINKTTTTSTTKPAMCDAARQESRAAAAAADDDDDFVDEEDDEFDEDAVDGCSLRRLTSPKIETFARGGSAACPPRNVTVRRDAREHGQPSRSGATQRRRTHDTTTTTLVAPVKRQTAQCPAHISASLPDILEHISAFGENNGAFDTRFDIIADGDGRQPPNSHRPHQQRRRAHRISVYASPPTGRRYATTGGSGNLHWRPDFSIVSSVPSCLNICISTSRLDEGDAGDDDHSGSLVLDRNSWNVSRTTATAFSAANSVVVGVSKNTGRRAGKLDGAFSSTASTSVAAKNFDLCDLETASFGQRPPAVSGKQLKVINASYNNLTVLDYSGGRQTASSTAISTFRAMAEQRKQQQQRQRRHDAGDDVGDREVSVCTGNFLLDEISAHFDRNLSILNDRQEHGDSADRWQPNESIAIAVAPVAPVPPPRKQQSQQSKSCKSASASSSIIDLQPATYAYTFDRDPTNLVTAYAASLERCNFELTASAQSIADAANRASAISQSPNLQPASSADHSHQHHVAGGSGGGVGGSGGAKRHQIVSSTPNLCHTDALNAGAGRRVGSAASGAGGHNAAEQYLHTSSTHTSMQQIPAATGSVSTDGGLQGILQTGSRQSLGKGVSFCPVVSEISWKEQSSEECVESDHRAIDNEQYDSSASSDEDNNINENDRYAADDGNDYADELDNGGADVNDRRNCVAHESRRSTRAPDRDIQIAHDVDNGGAFADDDNDDDEEDAVAADTTTNNGGVRLADDDVGNGMSADATADDDRSPNNADDDDHWPSTYDSSTPRQRTQRLSAAVGRAVIGGCRSTFSDEHAGRDCSPPPQPAQPAPTSTPRTLSVNASVPITATVAPHQQQQSTAAAAAAAASATIITDQRAPAGRRTLAAVAAETADTTNGATGQAHIMIDTAGPTTTAVVATTAPTGKDAKKLVPEKPVKPPKTGGFLSRFTGFRFSLRGGSGSGSAKKQKSPKTDNNNASSAAPTKSPAQRSNAKSPDYIYIPLKEPASSGASGAQSSANDERPSPARDCRQSVAVHPSRSASQSSSVTASAQSSPNASMVFRAGDQPLTASTPTAGGGHAYHQHHHQHVVVTTKPPLPKQPPRIVGVSAKQTTPPYQQQPPTSASSSSPHSSNGSNGSGGGGSSSRLAGVGAGAAHAQQMRASVSVPREINDYDSDYESVSTATRFSGSRGSQHGDGDGDYEASCTNTTGTSSTGSTADYYASHQHNNNRTLPVITSTSTPYKPQRRYFGMSGAEQQHADDVVDEAAGPHQHRIGLIETNLDTHETVISGKTRSLMELGPQMGGPSGGGHHSAGGRRLAGGHGQRAANGAGGADAGRGAVEPRRPHKSMEFLLDKENQRNVLPPENELQKLHDNNVALSEHQLRVQASLQRLNIPDWYKQYTAANAPGTGRTGYVPGSFARKRNSDTTGSSRWVGLNSKTTSLSSLGTTSLHVSAAGGGGGGGGGGCGSSIGDRNSPVMLSPSAHSHHGGQTIGGFQRWSTSHLCSTQTSPSVSQRSSFSRGGTPNASMMSTGGGYVQTGAGVQAATGVRSSFRQPYMGWRSQEKLSQPRTPSERLASSLLARQQTKHQQHQQQPINANSNNSSGHSQPASTLTSSAAATAVTPEIQSSIKEVTSAIVHFVNDQTRPSTSRSRSTSPTARKCWLESSFVGNRPLDSPQTPTIDQSQFAASGSAAAAAARRSSDNPRVNGGATNNPAQQHYFALSPQQQLQQLAQSPAPNSTAPPYAMYDRANDPPQMPMSPSSATLEDVLASLLGLPSNHQQQQQHSRSPDHYHHHHQQHHQHHTITASAGVPPSSSTTNFNRLQVDAANSAAAIRRRSEGDAQRRAGGSPAGRGATTSPSPLPTIAIGGQQHSSITSITAKPPPYSGPNATNTNQQQQQQQQHISPNRSKTSPPTIDLGGARRTSLTDSPLTIAIDEAAANQLIRCRYPNCKTAPAAPHAAKLTYKQCHNCAHLYCSRECRRSHWDRHRRACLHSRVSALCRQVLAACKDDADTLVHLSRLARGGHGAHGRGVVRVLFRTAEAAESFVRRGYQALGEASYVRWPELQPQEMGAELYAELLRLSTEYRPDAKMLVYVAVCVVSETPAAPSAGAGAVRWERQLVSRCAKLKLSRLVAGGGGGGGKDTAAKADSAAEVLLPAQPAIRTVPSVGNGRHNGAAHPTTGAPMDVLILAFSTAQRHIGGRDQRVAVQSRIVAALHERGVQLRKHFPEVFQRLAAFVEMGGPFAAEHIHPRDTRSGNPFLCIIMGQAATAVAAAGGAGGDETEDGGAVEAGERSGSGQSALQRLHERMLGDGGGRVRVIDCCKELAAEV